jgi:energy-coupling factor transport system substrate-specific component
MIHPINGGRHITTLSKRVAILAIFTASAVSTNYLLIGVPNIKFMDLIVFSGGYVFGAKFGSTVAILTWLVYGTLNPFGFSILILLATMTGEVLFGIAGGFLGKRWEKSSTWGPDLRFGILGFLLTFLYDLYTNIISAFVAGIPVPIALITGIPFSIAHEFSNATFFMFGIPPITLSLQKVLRRFYDE